MTVNVRLAGDVGKKKCGVHARQRGGFVTQCAMGVQAVVAQIAGEGLTIARR